MDDMHAGKMTSTNLDHVHLKLTCKRLFSCTASRSLKQLSMNRMVKSHTPQNKFQNGVVMRTRIAVTPTAVSSP